MEGGRRRRRRQQKQQQQQQQQQQMTEVLRYSISELKYSSNSGEGGVLRLSCCLLWTISICDTSDAKVTCVTLHFQNRYVVLFVLL
jgi:hypothetical protein